MAIRLYNSMTRKKEVLQTIEPGKVRFYACGPTVYNRFHIGNARMFVVFDTVRRYLEYRGYDVRFVQNFTDVDDKIIARANELGIAVREVADMYIAAYFDDVKALNVREATVHPRVTECIPDIIAFISELIAKKHAYEAAGDVYFDTSSFPDYGKLSGQSVDEMRSGFRIDVNQEKADPSDFALWKAAKPGEEFWDSPWGPGRPGWHIECSVMNAKYLGEEIDIHAGGRDLLFPHHENEIAQSEAHSDHVFARYWMHNGTLNINGEKMSKSLGNFIMTNDLLSQREPRVVRLFLLGTQYRHPLNYTEEAIDQAVQSLERIDRALTNLRHRHDVLVEAPHYLVHSLADDSTEVAGQVSAVRGAFVDAMDDDFNTADGIAALFEGVRLANIYLTQSHVTPLGLNQWRELLEEVMEVIGIETAAEAQLLEADILAEIEARNLARARRDFQEADRIRDELALRGVVLEDTPQGTRWTRS